MTEYLRRIYSAKILRQLSHDGVKPLIKTYPPTYLSNQTGEHKDAYEKVRHLKGNLKGGYGLWKTPDVDQTADSVVVTTQVPVEGQG